MLRAVTNEEHGRELVVGGHYWVVGHGHAGCGHVVLQSREGGRAGTQTAAPRRPMINVLPRQAPDLGVDGGRAAWSAFCMTEEERLNLT